MLEIPRLSIGELGTSGAPNRLGQVLKNPGVVLISGLDHGMFDRLYEQARIFYGSADKAKFHYEALAEGYKSLRSHRESFVVSGLNGVINVLGQFPDFQSAIKEAYVALDELSAKLLTAIDTYLQKRTRITNYLNTLRALSIHRYAPVSEFPSVKRQCDHWDTPSVLLPAATQEGLEVLIRREWRKVPLEPGTAVFIPGESLERYSDGTIRTLWHQVENPEQELDAPRFSLAFSIK